MTLRHVRSDKPLHGWQKRGVEVAAAFAILVFYLFAAAAVLVLSLLLVLELALALALARFGLTRGLVGPIQRNVQLLRLCLRSAWLREPRTLQVPLTPGDAPRLFEFLNRLAVQFRVAPPKQVLIEMNAGAWVRLRGVRRGANATTLGLGYDLVAALSERELEAVLAHEMAHARFVRRGLKRIVSGGMARAANLANALGALVESYRRVRQRFETAEWMLAVAQRCARFSARLVAAYSRQDEFEADRGAVALCGAAPLRSSLLKLEAVSARTARISWSERAAQIQGGRFREWLMAELDVATEGSAAAAAETFNPYATHPSLRDRLAALPPEGPAAAPARPALELFVEANAIARRLVSAIHEFAAEEERRDSRQRRKWLRRLRRGTNVRGWQWAAALVVVVGLIIAVFAWAGEFTAVPLLVGAAIVAGGAVLYRFGRYRDRFDLSVPTFEQLWEQSELSNDDASRDERGKAHRAELAAQVALLRGEQRAAKLLRLGAQALASGDFVRAIAAERLVLEGDRRNELAHVIGAVAWASLKQGPQAMNLLGAVTKATGLRSTSTLWGAAWALVMMGEWASAEPMLEELRAADPHESTFTALLALCQSRRNKLQSGIVNARAALAAAPRSPRRVLLLANMLVSAGYLDEAEQLLSAVADLVEGDTPLLTVMVRLQMMRREFAQADAWIGKLRQRALGGDVNVTIGALCETARRDDEAAQNFQAALAKGFYPAAELGLARLALHRGDFAAARAHALAALDTTKPIGPSSARAIDLLPSVIVILSHSEQPAEVAAWVVTRTANQPSGPKSFLVYARDEGEAAQFVTRVLNALQPAADPPPVQLRTERAPEDRQPVASARPGIQLLLA